ncbi:MAG TPA: alanyl-tRNA editing protein [Jatrophihabitans sp.]|jgi:misacylated tRNA(Ala) deacylase|nr:alanyl-tRNA editing protein [Jatrophihabitans sp.]
MTATPRTHRLDWEDPTLREWQALVLWSDPGNPEAGIVLDRSAFYPGGGGQPPDEGVLLWQGVTTRIVGTRKGEDLYLIPDAADPIPPAGTHVQGALDDQRRTLLMRTHSGLHVLCGTVFRDFGALVTGGNMNPGEARLDFDLPQPPPNFKADLEAAVNREVVADRRIVAKLLPREQALADPAVIRTVAVAPPADTPQLRLIDIEGLDVQADGGTHVASTRQIGHVQVTKVENKGRHNRRVRIKIID